MPTTIFEAFKSVNLEREGTVRWGSTPAVFEPGVYVVSLTDSLDTCEGKLIDAPLATAVFDRWLNVCPELTLDDVRPTVVQLQNRIRSFWLPDEVILYVGLATSLSARLGAFYQTPIGARGPHSGGYFLKLLCNLEQLWVHYALCHDPAVAENGMLLRFCSNVSDDSRRSLLDPGHPFPFANLEWPHGVRKAHGLRGTRQL